MMKTLIPSALFAALTLTSSPALAAGQIVNAAVGDFNRDGAPDLVTLTADPEEPTEIGIAVYLRDKDRNILFPTLAAPRLFWGSAAKDSFTGQEPEIAATATGSIRVTTKNNAIGRHRWEQTLTIAHRDGGFVVAGFTYSHYDTIDPDTGGSCDLNLLTGAGLRDQKPLKAKPQRIALADWKGELGLAACGMGG